MPSMMPKTSSTEMTTTSPLRLALLAAACAASALAAPPSPTAFNVEWRSPSLGPGTTQGGVQTHKDGMPLGNGGMTVLGWSVANATAGPAAGAGLSLYVGHQNAQSSMTELWRMGQVDVLLTPNPFASSANPAAPFYNQTLYLSTATLYLYLGGSSAADYNALLTAWVDATTDTLFITAAARDPASTTYSLSVTVTSTRPSTPWSYTVPFGVCAPAHAQPDVFVDPLPSGLPLDEPAPLTPEWAIRHASSRARPLRALPRPLSDTLGAFLPSSVITYHRNVDSDGLSLNDTLTQQGIPQLLATTPDWWRDLQSGMVVDSGAGPALNRSSPSTLTSTAPAGAFEVRITALAVQTNTSDEWLADLSALVTTRAGRGAAQARPAHEAWWAAFWARSYIAVNMTNMTGGGPPEPTEDDLAWDAGMAAAERGSSSASASLPVAGASLWVRASSIAAANATPVSTWRDESGSGWDLTQSNAPQVPTYRTDAFGPSQPGVVFDGQATFLESAAATVDSSAGSTFFAVFRDDGSSGGSGGSPCCSGVIYVKGACNGISTVPADSTPTDDDDTSPPSGGGPPIVVNADYSGFSTDAGMNIRGRTISVAVTYNSGSSAIYVDGCLMATSTRPGTAGQAVQVGTRNDELGRYFLGAIGEVAIYPRVLNSTEIAAMTAYFAGAWPAIRPKKTCRQSAGGQGYQVSQMYAITRYVQAVQTRAGSTIWPIKFNGMAYIAALNDGNGAADKRDWGPSNWWQNTRLPYGAMLPAGDFDSFRVILDYYANEELLLSPRTQAYWGHSGMWTTETHHLSGAYDQSDYGCSRPAGYPVSIMTSGYLHVDQGGDSGTGEYSLMALDYLQWTGDATTFADKYMVLATQAAEYFMNHYQNRSADGRVVVWPAQVLETWWCDWANGVFTNCCADDAPTISGMMTLFEKLLALPPSLTTPAQRAAWQSFVADLIPALPLSADNATIAPARILSSGTHNDEGPELYAMHPHRVFTKGREVASGTNISLGLATLAASGFARENSGWK
jgi:hypothetical protein